MNFLTFGPFELREISPDAIDKLFDEIKAAKEGLDDAIGVYIFAKRSGRGKLIPLYVGKTDRGFGVRFRHHLDVGRFAGSLTKGDRLNIFLIAHATSPKRLKRVTPKMRDSKNGMKSINELEFALIGSCIELNPNLINKRESRFHRTLHVPGYWNSPAHERDASAKKLAAMLKITR
jgi:hypothetical protein